MARPGTGPVRRSDRRGPKHIVSTVAADQRLALGRVKKGEKSNDIIAIPKILRIGCQRDIAQTMLTRKSLALKGNLGADVKLFVDELDEQKAVGFKDARVNRDKNCRGRSKPNRNPRDCRQS